MPLYQFLWNKNYGYGRGHFSGTSYEPNDIAYHGHRNITSCTQKIAQ